MGAAFLRLGVSLSVDIDLNEFREFCGLPVNATTVDSWQGLRGDFGSVRAAGEVVNEKTAMRVSAVYACVRLIAGTIAQLPVHVYRRGPTGERTRIDHNYWWLLNEQPSPAWTASAMWEFIVASMLLRGDGYGYLIRNMSGEVVGIMPLHPSAVMVEKKTTGDPRKPYRLFYSVMTDDGAFGVDQDDMLHFPGFGFDGCHGKSVIEFGALDATGLAIGANKFAGDYFAGGGQYQYAVKAAGKMGEAQQAAFITAWQNKYGTGANKNQIPLILTEGLDISELSVTAKDAQLLESRQYNAVDIARAFGVPAFMINENAGSTAWGSGIEQMGIGFVTFTQSPHLKRISHELNRKLFRVAGIYVAHNTAALMQGDNKSRAEYYKAALGGTQNPGWLTQNEVRQLENQSPIGGGDILVRPDGGANVTEPAETDSGQPE